ncbi:protease IV [Burkholderiales bacterium]|nr:MAG: S49 family peptidase [Burkholderiales bacterium]CAG0979212.1 protease IV [Burkholderiales bacterium]
MADNEGWERTVIEKLAMEAVKEQRRARQWSILFRFLTLTLVFLFFAAAMGWLSSKDGVALGKHTAVVDLVGVIMPEGDASAEHVIAGLQAAFKDKNTKGVILRINSPGGSPVQAGQIYDEMRRLRQKYPEIALYAVVDDICASGGYYAAVAADKIYVDKASLVGSIGVLMNGFGFTGTLDKLGIERRLLTAGENKGFLDPFSPMSDKHRDVAKKLLEEIHQQFITVVKEGRGTRLKNEPEVFSGLAWNGARSIELGLVDALGSVEFVAREVIGAEQIVDFTVEEGFAERFAKRLGTALGKGVGSVVLGETSPLR